MIKGNNGSGTVIIVRSKHKSIIDDAKRATSEWLLRDQSLTFAEWQYRWIDPCLLIEELLTDSMGRIPIDFKFYCFHGRPQFVQLDVDRFTAHQRVFVDLNYERLPFGLIYPNHVDIPQQPSCWQEMIGVAAALAGTEPFVRIDLFDFQGSPRFGEITLHPEAGCGTFYPKSWDVELGKLI